MIVCALQVVFSIDSSSYTIRLGIVIVVNAGNLSTYKADAEGSEAEDHPSLYGGFKKSLGYRIHWLKLVQSETWHIYKIFNLVYPNETQW